jgi:hypothetical protein
LSENEAGVRTRQEKLRLSFRPDSLRILFIGESPPASGRFFYQGDSGLYRAMRDAFSAGDASVNDENFLTVFRSAGCYLIDLCMDPVDRLDPRERRDACRAGEEMLSSAIAATEPPLIVTLLRSIEGNVARAVATADWHGRLIHLPYPGRWSRHRAAFLAALVPVINDVRSEGNNIHVEISHPDSGRSTASFDSRSDARARCG